MHSKKLIPLVLFLLLAIPNAVPADYYADVEISIDSSGRAAVSGTTNHPILSIRESDSFTSKNGAYWLFNMSFPESFSDYIYSVALPAGASINYIKAENPVRIESAGGRISVIGTGHLQNFSIAIQYRIPKRNGFGYPALAVFSSLVLAGLILYLASRHLERKGKSPESENKNEKTHEKKSEIRNYSHLPERQKAIIEFLEKSKKPLTQKAIEKELKIPKASVSRNIDSLVRRGILSKEETGMSNLISFSEKARTPEK